MYTLALTDLKPVLTDLLTKRRPALESTDMGKSSLPMLQSHPDCIAALPPALTGGKAFRRDAAALRSSAIGLFNRARSAIAYEVAFKPALPRDLDTQVFAYLDQHHEDPGAAAAKTKKVAAPTKDGADTPVDEAKPKEG